MQPGKKKISLRPHPALYNANPTPSSTATHESCAYAHGNPSPTNIYNRQNTLEPKAHLRHRSSS